MKTQRSLISLAVGALLAAGVSTTSAQNNNGRPVVITPPAVKDGSNWSRAPFPAQRQMDDVKSPDGQAIDTTLPPNSPASNIEPPTPPPRVAIFQSAPTPTPTAVDPGVLPTGRVAVATSLNAQTFAPTIRSATFENRAQIIADIESRVQSTESALDSLRRTNNQLSADARRSFDTAANDLKDKAKALRKSIDSARKATAGEWENARAQLAANFDDYATSVARIDATAGIAPVR
jgi:vacuolar-type H+-ATPase subunit H